MGVYPYLRDNEYRAFQEGTFELDCPEMCLTRQTPEGAQVLYGSGYIRQTTERELVFKLYTKQAMTALEALSGLFGIDTPKSGEIIPPNQFYDLTVTDIKDRQWIAHRILPDAETSLSGSGTVWSGSIHELTCTTEMPRPPGRDFLSLEFYGDFRVPSNEKTTITKNAAGRSSMSGQWNIHVCTSGDTDFRFVRETRALVVEATPKDQDTRLPNRLEMRITEALQFLFAREIYWELMQGYQNKVVTVAIRSSRGNHVRSGLRPPLDLAAVDSSQSFSYLFDRYVRYILLFTEDEYHPFSTQIRAVCRSSAGSLEARVLMLSVAIEGILRGAYSEFGQPTEEQSQQIAELREYLCRWAGPDELRLRADGTLRMMQAPRALDQLKELAERDIVDAEHVKVWQKMRNSSAHATLTGTLPLQELSLRCNDLMVLLYQLVFYRIGYRGKYIDYGTRDWPEREYSPRGVNARGSKTDA